MAVGITNKPSLRQDCLLILDSRTHRSYQIPIENNSVSGSDIGSIVGPATGDDEDLDEVQADNKKVRLNGATNGNANGHTNGHSNGNGDYAATKGDGDAAQAARALATNAKLRGLRILDPGLENIAIMKSSITFMQEIPSRAPSDRTSD